MKKSMKTTLAAAAVSLLTACGDVTVSGPSALPPGAQGLDLPRDPVSGETATESRDVHGFDAIAISGVGFLSIEQTGVESLTISAEPRVLPNLTAEVVDGLLVLGVVPGSELSTNVPIEYRITVAEIDEISVAGVVRVEATGIAADRLRIRMEGLSHIEASGATDSQDIVIEGLGRFLAADLTSREARIRVSGGSALLRVSDRLDAQVNGFGLVEYYGDPVVTADVSGSGRVRRVGS